MAPSMRELSAAEPLTEGVDSFRLAFGEPPPSKREAAEKRTRGQKLRVRSIVKEPVYFFKSRLMKPSSMSISFSSSCRIPASAFRISSGCDSSPLKNCCGVMPK